MLGTWNLSRQRWWLAGLTLFTFLFLLGDRSLNEPDEGRYATIAQAMIQRGDWLVPHFWYVPHLDKPPMTYWLVAASMSVFGQNEWAVRLPLALAGMAGVLLAYLFARNLAGERAALWAALILQSSLLYFVMARMLTTDIFLTQFIGWAIYCFWRGWQSLEPGGEAKPQAAQDKRPFLIWHSAGWAVMGLGFLTKGPIALAVPLVAMLAVAVYRRKDKVRRKVMFLGVLVGVPVFLVVAVPWFLLVFQRVPKAFDFMVYGQAVGHALGTTIKNRQGHPLYFFAILAVGFLPWTILLGWLWRRAHWWSLSALQKDGWVMLSAWSLFTFGIFTLSSSKLPAYILPMFPALAVMVAMRWFGEKVDDQRLANATRGPGCPLTRPAGAFSPSEGKRDGVRGASKVSVASRSLHTTEIIARPAPDWAWRVCLCSAPLLLTAVPVAIHFAFRLSEPLWLKIQFTGGLVALILFWWFGGKWSPSRRAAGAVALALVNLYLFAFHAPSIETSLRSNQTLKPLAAALKREYREGDAVVCWGRLPQGLPFYSHPVINERRRPLMGGMPLGHVPFAFPGNRERFGDLLIKDEAVFKSLLSLNRRVLVVAFQGTFDRFQVAMPDKRLRLLARVGQWELFANR